MSSASVRASRSRGRRTPACLHARSGCLLEWLQRAVGDDVGEGLDQAPVGVPGQPRVAGQRDQTLDALVAEPDIQHASQASPASTRARPSGPRGSAAGARFRAAGRCAPAARPPRRTRASAAVPRRRPPRPCGTAPCPGSPPRERAARLVPCARGHGPWRRSMRHRAPRRPRGRGRTGLRSTRSHRASAQP